MTLINKILNKIKKIGRYHQILMDVDSGHLRITKKGKVKSNNKK